ncbi:MAG: TIGR03790 family protein [Deltaproteobacteria bacterium]|nr:TIGR03790 family protein [Deltaproteobacteria bacterium]
MKYMRSILPVILVLVMSAPAGAELKAEDIIIVFNRNMAESRSVSKYYSKKRGVPPKNIVGVNVSTSESMGRREYEKKLLPHVRPAIEKLKAEGRNPAVLLVYGIPLKIKEWGKKKEEETFKKLAAARVREYQELMLRMIMEVETLIGDKNNTTPATVEEAIKRGDRTTKEALSFIKTPSAGKKDREKKMKVASIIFRLTGFSSVAREIERKQAGMGRKDMDITEIDGIVKWNAILERQLNEVSFYGIFPENAGQVATAIRITRGIMGELIFWDNLLKKGDDEMNSSSVDSELTMVMAGPYQLNRWLGNPLNKIYDSLPGIEQFREKVVMVGRLDGPTAKSARRLVDDALEVEKKGLKGTFYIDARGLKGKDSYGRYDSHLYALYDRVKRKSKMKTVFNDEEGLFPPDCCKDAALYVGWYSLGKYVDSFDWVKGAVAFHVASSEASTLRKKGSQVWVKRMLEEGVAASIGPVSEPYLDSFPLPHIFFPLLMTGKHSLMEAYYQSTPYLSWRQLIIGDPLYRPFKGEPAIPLN